MASGEKDATKKSQPKKPRDDKRVDETPADGKQVARFG